MNARVWDGKDEDIKLLPPMDGIVAPAPGDAPHPKVLREWVEVLDLTSTQKLTLAILLNHVEPGEVTLPERRIPNNDLSSPDWWSVRRLAELVRKSVRHTRRVLHQLGEEGLVRRHLRTWASSRIEVVIANLRRQAVAAQAAFARRAEDSARAFRGLPPAPPTEEGAPPPERRPQPAPQTPNRATRRAAHIEAQGGELPEWELRPTIGRVAFARAWPHEVPWALRQADICRARWVNPPSWVHTEEGRAVIAVGCLLHPPNAQWERVKGASALLKKPLGVLYRGAHQPNAGEFVDVVARVLWHNQSEISGLSGGDTPFKDLWRSGRWGMRAINASAAWDAATAEGYSDKVVKAQHELALLPARSEDWLSLLAAEVYLASNSRSDLRVVEALRHLLAAAYEPEEPPDLEPIWLQLGGVDPPPDEEVDSADW